MSSTVLASTANFGRIEAVVRFGNITCKKTEFSKEDGSVDFDNLEKYGIAIKIAKLIKDLDWFITDEGFLVCGDPNRSYETRVLNLSIDKNLKFLTDPTNQNRLKAGRGFEIKIDSGPFVEGKDWCIFTF